MGLLDAAMSALSGNATGNADPLMSEAMNLIQNQPGGLSGLMQQFHSGGLGDVVQSWIGSGANQPVSGPQIQQVLGNDAVQQIAAKVGIDPTQAASGLAQMLPQLVDHLTPGGQIPEGNELAQGLGVLKGLLG